MFKKASPYKDAMQTRQKISQWNIGVFFMTD